MNSKESLDEKTYNELTAAGVFIGICICFYGVFSRDASIVTAGVTFFLAAVTAHYAYTTKQALELNKKSVELMIIEQKKPRIEKIANNFLQPIDKEAGDIIGKILSNSSVFQIILFPNKKNPLDLSLGMIESLIFFSLYEQLKNKCLIDPKYPDETLIKRYEKFNSQISEIETRIHEIGLKALLFSERIYSFLDVKYQVEGTGGISNEVRSITKEDCIFLKLAQKYFSNPCLVYNITEKDGSVKTHKDTIGNMLIFNSEVSKELEHTINKFYADHQKELDSFSEQINDLNNFLFTNLLDIRVQISDWEKEWIRKYSIDLYEK